MNKEMLDIVNDLSKKPTTELALQIMELSSENLILEQQVKKQNEVIDKVNEFIKELYDNTDDTTCYEIDKNRKVELLNILKEV